MPALGPVPTPEVTPAASRLVPVFPLHVAPWLVSNCVRRPGHTESGPLTAHLCSTLLGNARLPHPQTPTCWRRDLSESFSASECNL